MVSALIVEPAWARYKQVQTNELEQRLTQRLLEYAWKKLYNMIFYEIL